jgi:hypothetical protein
MGFAVNKVALGWILRQERRVSPVSVIPPALEVHSVTHSSITDAISFPSLNNAFGRTLAVQLSASHFSD